MSNSNKPYLLWDVELLNRADGGSWFLGVYAKDPDGVCGSLGVRRLMNNREWRLKSIKVRSNVATEIDKIDTTEDNDLHQSES